MESIGSFTSGTWQEQRFRVTATFGANSDDASVWELASLLLVNYRSCGLCRNPHAIAAQFLCDIPSKLPLCGNPRSVRMA